MPMLTSVACRCLVSCLLGCSSAVTLMRLLALHDTVAAISLGLTCGVLSALLVALVSSVAR